MKDPRLAKTDPNAMPFDCKRMAYGGFEVLVDAIAHPCQTSQAFSVMTGLKLAIPLTSTRCGGQSARAELSLGLYRRVPIGPSTRRHRTPAAHLERLKASWESALSSLSNHS